MMIWKKKNEKAVRCAVIVGVLLLHTISLPGHDVCYILLPNDNYTATHRQLPYDVSSSYHTYASANRWGLK